MTELRNLTPAEIERLKDRNVSAAEWFSIRVSEDFTPSQLTQCRLEGTVEIESGVTITYSRVSNYHIGAGTLIDGVEHLTCRHRSPFGNGVEVAPINECRGRRIRIFESLTAQIAYLGCIYRHRPLLIEALDRMAMTSARDLSSEMGRIGRNCRLTGARSIREVCLRDEVVIDGATLLENATLGSRTFIGADVKAYDFITAEDARIGNGTIVDHCFVGECCTLDKGFNAADSLFFANSHCENGEASAIFAGPFTVSHHKSTLLIAGMFSFFNAGSGSNQSNLLFKSGPVHQSVHLRGCKFASSAYIMSPALEGAFTMVMGSHTYHHDTSKFPCSYLIERNGESSLMPGANLSSCGLLRDLQKWPARDRRTTRRDRINFEEHNPYVTRRMIQGLEILRRLEEQDPYASVYMYNRVRISSAALRKGIKLYERAITAALGDMLRRGQHSDLCPGGEAWLDLAGQYITRQDTEGIIARIETGAFATPGEIDNAFRTFFDRYDDHAHTWAYMALSVRLGHEASEEEVGHAITEGAKALEEMRLQSQRDHDRDCSPDMAISYGLDCDDEEERLLDFKAVRGL